MRHELLGMAMVVYPVRATLEAGADHVALVVGEQQQELVADLEPHVPADRWSVCPQAAPRGTADAVLAARDVARGHARVMVVNGDAAAVRSETLRALAAALDDAGGPLALVTADMDPATPYGRVVRDGPHRPQDRRDLRLDRHARTFRPPRRSEPRRPRYARDRRRGPDTL